MKYLNISAYKFVTLDNKSLLSLQATLKSNALDCGIKGTILISVEGINLSLAGEKDQIQAYQSYLTELQPFQDLSYKQSYSEALPFSRLLVRIKKEIISMGGAEVKPEQKTADYLSPHEFKQWYDENRDMVVLDTRNDYEVVLGKFQNAIHMNLETFREFPQAIRELPEEMKEKPIVTYCTGGIRCEKASALMQEHGFKNVYQLQGGILNYFEKCGGENFQGECFIFDDRIAVDAKLEETGAVLCGFCQKPLTLAQQQQNCACPYCQNEIFR